MLSKVWSAATLGIEAVRIVVEVDARHAQQPGFSLVGLPDIAVRESYARVRSAIVNCGFSFPVRHITVNLAPGDVRKEGSGFDLPIALGILHALECVNGEEFAGRVFVGELSLDGTLTAIRGTLAVSAALANDRSIRELIVPAPNANEAAAVERLRVIGVPNLPALLQHLRGESILPAAVSTPSGEALSEPADFADVRGQVQAKRALEVAASGGHNVMMIGPPGLGKDHARQAPGLHPPAHDRRRSHRHHQDPLRRRRPPHRQRPPSRRPFRAPHHTISTAGMAGGGTPQRPGEVSLAHHGVLFLDELPEFRRATLEAMRQPIEDGTVTIARAARTVAFPARFVLAAALNPCPCGFFNHGRRQCICTQHQIARYLAKISGPLLDRIDLQVEVAALTTDEITSVEAAESSVVDPREVEAAREIQHERFHRATILCNAEMTTRHMRKYCELDPASRRLLVAAIERLGLSARAHDRILKVARTIADLAGRKGWTLRMSRRRCNTGRWIGRIFDEEKQHAHRR